MVTGTVQVPTAAVPAHFEVSTDVASVRRGDSDSEPASRMAGPTHQSLITVMMPVIQVSTVAGGIMMAELPEVQVQVFHPAMDSDSDSEAEFP